MCEFIVNVSGNDLVCVIGYMVCLSDLEKYRVEGLCINIIWLGEEVVCNICILEC